MRKLTEAQVSEELAKRSDWTLHDGKLRRELEFSGFVQAFGFMASLALVAESRNHHPEWTNVYNRVVVEWTTHDVGGISDLDFELADTTDSLALGAASK